MCTVFKAAVREALPHAMLAVDHFHVVQLANRAVTEVRRPDHDSPRPPGPGHQS